LPGLIQLPFRKALILAPHTDDEFACSGTALRLMESGAEVHCAAFSQCQESVPAGLPPDILAHEFRASAAVLGIPEHQLHIFDFSVRHFPASRQAILEEMVTLRKKITPDVVFVPASSDVHQDHGIVTQEGFRCFKSVTVLGYELPWNQREFRNDLFIEITVPLLERKIKALECYVSQRFRSYANAEFFRSLAKVRGVQAGCELAEAFEVLRVRL
jgi:N-acetylglucosamine malate deacetylase 1